VPDARPAATRRRIQAGSTLDLLLAVLAIAIGLGLAWLDTRPHFDDTGVLVTLLFAIPVPIAAISGRRPWLWALLVGAPVPLAELVSGGSPAAVAAIAVAGVGAAIGYAIGRMVRTTTG
jgi:hypothetical protein